MRIENRMVVGLLAALISGNALAKCEFRQETNDFFSGVPTLRTVWTQVNPGECKGACTARGSLSMVKEPGRQRIEFDAWFTRSFVFVPEQIELDNTFVVPAETVLEVTLADGSTVQLPIFEPVRGATRITYPYENKNDNYIVHAQARMHFVLGDDALNALASQRSAEVRVVGPNAAVTIPVPRKKQAIMDAAKCLQNGGAK